MEAVWKRCAVLPSRRCRRFEAGRNVELMRLTGKLAPGFKTIADVRRDNGDAVRAACEQFVVLCRQVGLIAGGVVAVDGSRFKAVDARDKNDIPAAIRLRLAQVEASIERYVGKLDTADRREADVAEMRDLQSMARQAGTAPDRQTSLTDPDARAMATNGEGTGFVGHNVQAAGDADSHIVAAYEVTNIGHDRTRLANMGRQARDATGAEDLTNFGRSWSLLRC